MNKLLKRIVNGEFINVIYNDDIYLLVDEFVCDKKHIIYFNSLNNELFCYKKGKDYEIVEEEELIQKVKDENGLYKDEYLYNSKFKNIKDTFISQEIIGGERKLIIESFLDKIIKLNIKVPREELKSRLNNLRIKKVSKLKELGIIGSSSAYSVKSNTIFIKQEDIDSPILFHEMIHALTGSKNYDYNFLLGVGLIEGITEYKTIESHESNISSMYNGYEYNFNTHKGGTYIENACIASQLEYILGEDILGELTTRQYKFIEKFYRKYGLNTFISLRYKLNNIYKNNRKNNKDNLLFDKTQELLLRRVFDKEFESVNSKETATQYFDSLNTFGLFRARKDSEDTLLKDYFNEKKDLCSKKLKDELTDIKYEPVEFKNKFLPNEYDKRIINDVKSYLSLNYNENNTYRIYKFIRDDKYYSVFYSNDEIVFIKEYDLNGSRKVNIDFDISELEELKIADDYSKKL